MVQKSGNLMQAIWNPNKSGAKTPFPKKSGANKITSTMNFWQTKPRSVCWVGGKYGCHSWKLLISCNLKHPGFFERKGWLIRKGAPSKIPKHNRERNSELPCRFWSKFLVSWMVELNRWEATRNQSTKVVSSSFWREGFNFESVWNHDLQTCSCRNKLTPTKIISYQTFVRPSPTGLIDVGVGVVFFIPVDSKT